MVMYLSVLLLLASGVHASASATVKVPAEDSVEKKDIVVDESGTKLCAKPSQAPVKEIVHDDCGCTTITKTQVLEPAKIKVVEPVKVEKKAVPVNIVKGVAKVKDLSTYTTLTSGDGLVVVKFSAAWCSPCKAYAPIFKKVAGSLQEVASGDKKTGITYVEVDSGEAEDIARSCYINSIPATIFYKDGKKVETLLGLQSKDELTSRIKHWATA